MTTRTRNQFQTSLISLRYLCDTKHSFTRLAVSRNSELSLIMKPNEWWANLPKAIEDRYAEIQDQVHRGTFLAVLRTELLEDASLKATRYVISIKSNEDNEEQYKERYVDGIYIWINSERIPSIWCTEHPLRIGSHSSGCWRVYLFPRIGIWFRTRISPIWANLIGKYSSRTLHLNSSYSLENT